MKVILYIKDIKFNGEKIFLNNRGKVLVKSLLFLTYRRYFIVRNYIYYDLLDFGVIVF